MTEIEVNKETAFAVSINPKEELSHVYPFVQKYFTSGVFLEQLKDN